MATNDTLVLYKAAGATVTASLSPTVDGLCLFVSDQYCTGMDDPYWDSDDTDSVLTLGPGSTVRLADHYRVKPDTLLDELSGRYLGVRTALSRIIDDCHHGGIVTTTSKVPVFGELERTITAASDAP